MTNSTDTTPSQISSELLSAVPSIPKDDQGPVFSEPWQAEVFAMTLMLHKKKLFSWPEWADQLSRSIAAAQESGDPDLGNTYYLHWLDALETLVTAKDIGKPGQLADLYKQWETAANTTPHGQPIVLPPASKNTGV